MWSRWFYCEIITFYSRFYVNLQTTGQTDRIFVDIYWFLCKYWFIYLIYMIEMILLSNYNFLSSILCKFADNGTNRQNFLLIFIDFDLIIDLFIWLIWWHWLILIILLIYWLDFMILQTDYGTWWTNRQKNVEIDRFLKNEIMNWLIWYDVNLNWLNNNWLDVAVGGFHVEDACLHHLPSFFSWLFLVFFSVVCCSSRRRW